MPLPRFYLIHKVRSLTYGAQRGENCEFNRAPLVSAIPVKSAPDGSMDGGRSHWQRVDRILGRKFKGNILLSADKIKGKNAS